MHSVKPSETRKEQKESQLKVPDLSLLHQSDVMDDGIKVASGRQRNVNKLVARKNYIASEHSSSHVKEDHNSSITISKQFLVQLAFVFIMVINVIRSGLNMNLLKLKWVIGLAAVVCGRAGCVEPAGSPPTVPPDSFGGKRFYSYILPYTNVYASWMNYFDRYIKNLESEYRTMEFYCKGYLYTTGVTICNVADYPTAVTTIGNGSIIPLLRLPSVRSDLHRCPHLSGPDLHHKCHHRWRMIYHWYHWLTVYLTSDNLVTVSPTLRTPIVVNRAL